MPVRSFQFLRRFLADWRKLPVKSSSTRRRSPLPHLELLEDRITPSAGAQEQYMLDLINRFRANPAAELPLLLNSSDANVNNDLAFFHVDSNALAAQWATLAPAPPLAWTDFLASSALAHSQAMLAAQSQLHQVSGELDPWTRMVNAGYTNYSFLAENIFAYAHSIFEAEASFAIDWGDNPPTGIQSPAGHRGNLMDADLREIGIGIVNAPANSSMGPILVTQDFGNRFNLDTSYLLGNVFTDLSGDGFYEPGEGSAGVTLAITGSNGTVQTTTTDAGGYQIRLPAGNYQIVASGGGLAAPLSQSVTIGSVNVQVDFLRTAQAAPAAPAFIGPASPTASSTPTFSWTPITGATRYDLWVNNATTGQSQVIRNQTLTTTSFTPTTALAAGSYQAWVRVTTSAGTSAWSPTYSFTITPPPLPMLTGPSGATTSGTPTFSWTASAGATGYDLWVSNRTTGQNQIIRQTVSTTSFTPTTPLPLGSYQFWVQASNDAGSLSGWSATGTFSISGPSAPTFSAPVGPTSNTTPTLSWSTSSGATRYDLWISNVSTGQSPLIRQQNFTTTSFTPATPLPVGTYQAWVEAFNDAGNTGGWSATLNFSITPPAPPTLTGPATTTSTAPTLTWNASPGATRYDVWANNLTTGQSQVIRQTVTTTSLTPSAAIPRGQYVYWVAAASGSGAFGAWSTGFNFLIDTTAPAIPTINGPATSTSNVTPTVAWTGSAARFDLWVNNVTTGQTQIIRQQNLTGNSFTPTAALPLGNYVAWVQAFDNTNQTRGWSPTYSFTITAPAVPTQVIPLGTITSVTPTFSWSAVTDAVRYDLWVDKTTGPAQVIRQQNLSTNSYTPTTPLAKGSYRVWVRAFNVSGTAGNWSSEVDFTIA